MWMLVGLGAIIFAILNISSIGKNNKSTVYRFISLSFTALSLSIFFMDMAKLVENEDWASLMDIMPTMSKALLICTIFSILINSVSIFKSKK